ncbi:MAG: hypothetical protein V4574_15810 [Pseudomonadota bacterium]
MPISGRSSMSLRRTWPTTRWTQSSSSASRGSPVEAVSAWRSVVRIDPSEP